MGSLHLYWTTHEERDVDWSSDIRRRKRERGLEHAQVARQSLDAEFAVSALGDVAPSDRRALLALLLSPALDLRMQAARIFATQIFERAELDELTAAAIVRGAEAAARTGRTDLLDRARKLPTEPFRRAAPLLRLVAARLDRSGERDAARRLRRVLHQLS